MTGMFKSVFILFFRLTRREYFADFFITPPVTAAAAAVSLSGGLSVRWAALAAAGFAAWTLYEYALHRWLLHRAWFFRDVHGLHHARQKDYIALHPALTVASYAAFWIALGVRSSAFMVGFSTGYVIYSALHTAFHYAVITRESRLYRAKRRHALHHAIGDVNYGVTTALWDRLFGTNF